MDSLGHAAGDKAAGFVVVHHHTLHRCSFTIGCPALQPNAAWNSGMFGIRPLTRYLAGEWGLVRALARNCSGRTLLQAHCALPMTKRCAGRSEERRVGEEGGSKGR